MNSLKLGPVSVQRARVPACPSCTSNRRIQRDCMLCSGTGSYLECESCGKEIVYESADVFAIHYPDNEQTSHWRGRGMSTLARGDSMLLICYACLACTIAEALPELQPMSEPDYHIDDHAVFGRAAS